MLAGAAGAVEELTPLQRLTLEEVRRGWNMDVPGTPKEARRDMEDMTQLIRALNRQVTLLREQLSDQIPEKQCSADFVTFHSVNGMYVSHIGDQTLRKSRIHRLSASDDGIRLHTEDGYFQLREAALPGMLRCLHGDSATPGPEAAANPLRSR